MSSMERPVPAIAEKFATCDPVWSQMREEALRIARSEPAIASFVHATVLNHERLEDALTFHLAQKLGNHDVGAMVVREVFQSALSEEPTIGEEVRADLSAVYERDPAVNSYVDPFLFFSSRAFSRSNPTE
jgi:serine O-acetyltransferase